MPDEPSRSAVTIRFAVPADIPELGRIDTAAEPMFEAAGHPEFVGGGTIPDDVAHRAIGEDRILVAELDGVVVGWIYLTRAGGEWCVGQLSVDPVAHRRGIGTALMERVLGDARRAGEPTVVLNTQGDLPWNQPFYERFGFTVVPPAAWTDDMHRIAAEQTEAGLDWSTRVHMRLALTPPPPG